MHCDRGWITRGVDRDYLLRLIQQQALDDFRVWLGQRLAVCILLDLQLASRLTAIAGNDARTTRTNRSPERVGIEVRLSMIIGRTRVFRFDYIPT
jgi:hypothetical protein